MKAIRVHEFGGAENLRYEDTPDPTPAEGQVVVRIHAAGVNPVDTYIRSGTYARKPALPYTPGSDGAGVVESVGAGVALRPGQRVWTSGSLSGTYAEKALCLASAVQPLPERISYAQGAAVYVPYATAYRAVHQRARAVPGDFVLVHGASGGVGVAALQVCRAAGMRTIGTAGTDRGLALVREQGALEAVDHRIADRAERLLALTGGRGFDVILEMLANVNLPLDLQLLAPGGRVVVIGNRGPATIDARMTMAKDSSILGMSLANTNERDMLALHHALNAGLANGTFAPLAGRELPLAQAAEAHRLVLEPGAFGKIALIP
jgi:NADPH2:quinone reductase